MSIFTKKMLCVATLITGSLAWHVAFAPGPAQVQSSPSGAKVYLNGHYAGVTPCQVRHGEVRLEKEGYFPAWAFIRPRPGNSGEFMVALRPGHLAPSARPEEVPGFYPPARGRPPATYFYRKDQQLGRHPFALPPSWNRVSSEENSVRFTSGVRQATFSTSDEPLSDRLKAVRQQREEEGWQLVFQEQTHFQALLRLERPARGVLGVDRAVVLLELQSPRLLELNFDFPDCSNTFGFTRDLDYLRGSLGFSW